MTKFIFSRLQKTFIKMNDEYEIFLANYAMGKNTTVEKLSEDELIISINLYKFYCTVKESNDERNYCCSCK